MRRRSSRKHVEDVIRRLDLPLDAVVCQHLGAIDLCRTETGDAIVGIPIPISDFFEGEHLPLDFEYLFDMRKTRYDSAYPLRPSKFTGSQCDVV